MYPHHTHAQAIHTPTHTPNHQPAHTQTTDTPTYTHSHRLPLPPTYTVTPHSPLSHPLTRVPCPSHKHSHTHSHTHTRTCGMSPMNTTMTTQEMMSAWFWIINSWLNTGGPSPLLWGLRNRMDCISDSQWTNGTSLCISRVAPLYTSRLSASKDHKPVSEKVQE